jgi:hypothetical protein
VEILTEAEVVPGGSGAGAFAVETMPMNAHTHEFVEIAIVREGVSMSTQGGLTRAR